MTLTQEAPKASHQPKHAKLLLTREQLGNLIQLIQVASEAPEKKVGAFFCRSAEYANKFIEEYSTQILRRLTDDNEELYVNRIFIIGLIQFIEGVRNLILLRVLPNPGVEIANELRAIENALKESVRISSTVNIEEA